jgi:hypothetical protein
VGSAAPTAAEAKWGGSAEATVLERQMRPARGKTGLIAAIAAVVVLASGIGYFIINPPGDGGGSGDGSTSTLTATGATSGTEVVTTAPPLLGAGSGVLLLSATPWGDIDKIINAQNSKAVSLDDEKRSTPTRIELEAGKYFVTLKGPGGTQTFDVDIKAGQSLRKKVNTGDVNLDEITKEAIP